MSYRGDVGDGVDQFEREIEGNDLLPNVALVGQIGEEESLHQADEGEDDLDDPEGRGSLDPQDRLPVDDRVVHKLLRRLLVGGQVDALVTHLASVTGSSSQICQRHFFFFTNSLSNCESWFI